MVKLDIPLDKSIETIKLDEPFQPFELEAIKILFESRQSNLRFLAERSFTATLQAVTLNVIALAGLMASKFTLLLVAKFLGSAILIVFNLLVAYYLYSKDVNYQKIKTQLITIENTIINKCPSLKEQIAVSNNKTYSTWSGTGIFILAIVISCLCTVIALWVDLILVVK